MRPTITLAMLLALVTFGCSSQAEPESTSATPATTTGAEVTADVAVADPDDVHIEGDHLTIDGHINFETDSDVILGDSTELLDHIALMIGNHPEIAQLRIIGHTDESGDPAHNQDLSDRRAAAVEQALRDRGVAIELEHSGAGETDLLCTEDTAVCHAQNRRVEFLIVQ